jgi:outer membrane receptor for ferrienterochelin and colicin
MRVAEICGTEFICTYRPFSTTELKANYSYVKLLTEEFRPKMIFPTHQLKLSATHTFFDKLTLNSLFLFEPALPDDQIRKLYFDKVYLDSRNVLDITATYKIAQSLNVSFMVKNVLAEATPPMNDQSVTSVDDAYLG